MGEPTSSIALVEIKGGNGNTPTAAPSSPSHASGSGTGAVAPPQVIQDNETASPRGAEPSSHRVVHGSAPLKNSQYPLNRVSNTKYTVLSFIPKNLLEQFSQHINRYFLFIAILQLFTVLSPVNPWTTWVPLIVIFAVSATKEAIDDRARARADTVANERQYTVYRDGRQGLVQAQHIGVGDVVVVLENEEMPCDLVLIASTNRSGQAFIQTTNLDGESNLKSRVAVPATRTMALDKIERFDGVIRCPPPNRDLYSFDSRLWLSPSSDNGVPAGEALPLSGEQLLQQATRLRNTDKIYGIAVYTGNETKFGMNKGVPPTKITKSDRFVNLLAVYLFIFQFSLVIIFGAVGEQWRRDNGRKHWYMDYPDKDSWWEFLIIPLRFLLLNSTMIPISLKITLDIIKLFSARFIGWDNEMFDINNDGPAVANNTSIAEDLGQIEYVLTDKTGTLTQNNMVFAKCDIRSRAFPEPLCVPGGELHKLVLRGGDELDFFRNFALNNSVLPVERKGEWKNPGDPERLIYKGASPDEVALVRQAQYMGVRLAYRENHELRIEIDALAADGSGRMLKEDYTIMQELDFTSERQRMSLVLKNNATGTFRLYTKGADGMIVPRLRLDQEPVARQTMINLNEWAKQGLRTLVFAYRDLSHEDFTQWQALLEKARIADEDRAKKVAAVFAMLEQDLVLQGASAIEDKLQDLVPETIELLRGAGIKFWMLTGDKFSTAKEIANSCRLKSQDDRARVEKIQGTDAEEVGYCIRDIHEKYLREQIMIEGHEHQQTKGYELTVAIEGPTLDLAMAYHQPALTALLLGAHSVIGCRVMPIQKAALVKMVKDSGKMTLAIGDGGNDVGMIQQAHIGVGIRGQEGRQAARAADYTISLFHHLRFLLLVHGRYSYQRSSLVAQYSFYKSFFFCIIQIGYGFATLFSGSTLFNSLCIATYNALLFFPILTFCLNRDIPIKVALTKPYLYENCVKDQYFNYRTFAWWLLRGFLQAIIIITFTVYSRGEEWWFDKDGRNGDWEVMGVVAFTAFLWVQSFTMMLELNTLTRRNLWAIWGFHAFTYAILFLSNVIYGLNGFMGYGIFNAALRDPTYWLHNLLCIIACMVPVIAMYAYRFNWMPEPLDHLQYLVHLNGNENLPVIRDGVLIETSGVSSSNGVVPTTNGSDGAPTKGNLARPLLGGDDEKSQPTLLTTV